MEPDILECFTMLLCFVGLLDTLLTCSRSWWELLGSICWQHMLAVKVGLARQRIDNTNSDTTPHQGLLDQEQRFADTQDLWSFFADLCSELSWTTHPSTRPDHVEYCFAFSAYLGSHKVSLITNFKEHLRDEIGVAVLEVQQWKIKRRTCGTAPNGKRTRQENRTESRILLVTASPDSPV